VKRTKTCRVLVVMPGIQTSNWRKLEGVMDYVSGRENWEVEIVTNEGVGDLERAFSVRRPDGVICGAVSQAVGSFLAGRKVPVMVLAMPDALQVNCPYFRYFTSDNADVAHRAAEIMLDRGYSRFAYVHKARQSWDVERFGIFRRILAEKGRDVVEVDPSDKERMRFDAVKSLPVGTAVFAADDSVASALVGYCRRHGIDVPGHLAVLGVSNQKFSCRSVRPQITSIDQDFERGGYLAAKGLHSFLCGGMVPRETRYPAAGVVERASLPPFADALPRAVESAVDFIRAHVDEPIEVPDVVDAAGISRRSLEMLVRKSLNTSIAATIRSERLDRLASLLRETPYSLARVCEVAGWANESHAKRLFKERFGCTMSSYRAAAAEEFPPAQRKNAIIPAEMKSLSPKPQRPREGGREKA